MRFRCYNFKPFLSNTPLGDILNPVYERIENNDYTKANKCLFDERKNKTIVKPLLKEVRGYWYCMSKGIIIRDEDPEEAYNRWFYEIYIYTPEIANDFMYMQEYNNRKPKKRNYFSKLFNRFRSK